MRGQRKNNACKNAALIIVGLLGTKADLAFACSTWTSWTKVQFLYISNGGNYYIQPQTPLVTGADPCGCKHSNGTLQYFKSENPATDSTKGMMALAMMAKTKDTKLQVFVSQCFNNQPGSGYAIFTHLLAE